MYAVLDRTMYASLPYFLEPCPVIINPFPVPPPVLAPPLWLGLGRYNYLYPFKHLLYIQNALKNTPHTRPIVGGRVGFEGGLTRKSHMARELLLHGHSYMIGSVEGGRESEQVHADSGKQEAGGV